MVVQVGICQSQSTKDPSKLMPVSNEAISRMMQLEVVSSGCSRGWCPLPKCEFGDL